jgi:hypothetical protein
MPTASFSGNDISVLFPDKERTHDVAHEQHAKAPEAPQRAQPPAACSVEWQGG